MPTPMLAMQPKKITNKARLEVYEMIKLLRDIMKIPINIATREPTLFAKGIEMFCPKKVKRVWVGPMMFS
jgi:hypothetical protein